MLRADLLRVQENLADLRLSHDVLRESHDALRESHDALRESHDALRESHDALREHVLELRTRMDAGFSAVQVQLEQMARQMAVNLEIVLTEIRRERP